MCNCQANFKRLLDCVSRNDVEGVTRWLDKGLDPNFNTCGSGGNHDLILSLTVILYYL